MSLPFPSPRRLAHAIRELGALGPVAAFTVVGPAAGAALLIGSAPVWFEALTSLGSWAAPALVVATIVLAGLSLVPTHATSLVSGMLFGGVGGSLLALAGIAGAALLGHGLLRRWIAPSALAQLAKRPRAYAVHRALLHHRGRRTMLLIALIRLSPVMPFAATNLLMAGSGVRVRPFLAGTLLGIAPRVIAVAVAGAGLESLDLGRSGDRGLAVLGLAATALALVVAGRFARPVLREVASASATSESRAAA